MIEDIYFSDEFIMELPIGEPGGIIISYTTGGNNESSNSLSGETSHIFIN